MDSKSEKQLKVEEKKRIKEEKAAAKKAEKDKKAALKKEAKEKKKLDKLRKKGTPQDDLKAASNESASTKGARTEEDTPASSSIVSSEDIPSSSQPDIPPPLADFEPEITQPEASPNEFQSESANDDPDCQTSADQPVKAETEPESKSEPEPEPAAVSTEPAIVEHVIESEPPQPPQRHESDAEQPKSSAAEPLTADETNESSDSVPEASKGFIRKKASSRSSIRGAPAQLLPGQRASQAFSDDLGSVVEYDICTDEVDNQVGAMENEDAKATSAYLADVVDRLRERMKELWADGTNEGYQQEYQKLALVGFEQSSDASEAAPNIRKNRYGNILAYDSSRVKLPIVDEDPFSDYINASWVDAYKHPNGYIASQGPVPSSFVDFWRMIWLEKIVTIVMVTHEVEKGRLKCHRYWPDPTSNPPTDRLDYGDVSVAHVSSQPHEHFVVRTFLVRQGAEERTIKQFAYTSWPDHGVPLTTGELLGFRNAVNYGTPNKDMPILIHCSAGVGRTGTYIAIDSLVKQALDLGGELDVEKMIASLRMRRNYMVQTEMQYMFIYRAVLDCLTELLQSESKKAEKILLSEAEQQKLREAAELADRQKRQEDEKEQVAIQEARKTLEKEEMARQETSAENAKEVVAMSIQARKALLEDAERRWLENYQISLAEWSERNQFGGEMYDLTSTLTPVQSRLEALRQKGMLV